MINGGNLRVDERAAQPIFVGHTAHDYFPIRDGRATKTGRGRIWRRAVERNTTGLLRATETAVCFATYPSCSGGTRRPHTATSSDVDLNQLTHLRACDGIEDGAAGETLLGALGSALRCDDFPCRFATDAPLVPLASRPWFKTKRPRMWSGRALPNPR